MTVSPERIERCWKEALAVWGINVTLTPPEPAAPRGPDDAPLAFIDLERRQVVVDFTQLVDLGAVDSLAAVLSHEVGHHVRYPHTLGLAAELELLQRRLLPYHGESLTNWFFDLLVNEVVGRTMADQLVAVYRGFARQAGDGATPFFRFTLEVYEELWGLREGEISPRLEAFDNEYPGHRAEARVFAQTFWSLTDVHLQFVYFCSVVARYLPPGGTHTKMPCFDHGALPGPDDFADALDATDSADRALDEARGRGWIPQKPAPEDPLPLLDRVAQTRPGASGAAFRQAVVERHYRSLVEKHLIDVPRESPPPDPVLPTVLEEWEPGDDPKAIDWTATVLASGALAGLRPLRRELEADADPAAPGEMPAVEIYLDTSGSMPAPDRALNCMTLAALILATAAIRRKGVVRGVVYSWDYTASDWMYSEEVARRFLLRSSGGGTRFPFALLEKFADERDGAIRVIVSDSDFLSNVAERGHGKLLLHGIARSRRLVAFLAAGEKEARAALKDALPDPRFRLAIVRSYADFARAASSLADALFGRSA
jgi:hypothetical protein